jgi:hypothetical protein
MTASAPDQLIRLTPCVENNKANGKAEVISKHTRTQTLMLRYSDQVKAELSISKANFRFAQKEVNPIPVNMDSFWRFAALCTIFGAFTDVVVGVQI